MRALASEHILFANRSLLCDIERMDMPRERGEGGRCTTTAGGDEKLGFTREPARRKLNGRVAEESHNRAGDGFGSFWVASGKAARKRVDALKKPNSRASRRSQK